MFLHGCLTLETYARSVSNNNQDCLHRIHHFYLLQIKNLAAELCLDRALVLELLRNPPPDLLMMSLSVPDEPPLTAVEIKPGETVINETSMDSGESEPKDQLPIHAMQRSWSAQKRLKKAHIDTLERVYTRSKRPTVSKVCHASTL